MSRIVASFPPFLYNSLKAEGFDIPAECGDIQLLIPVEGAFQLHYTVNLTHDDLIKIGRALTRLAEEQKKELER